MRKILTATWKKFILKLLINGATFSMLEGRKNLSDKQKVQRIPNRNCKLVLSCFYISLFEGLQYSTEKHTYSMQASTVSYQIRNKKKSHCSFLRQPSLATFV